jgi:predicted DNA-binding antitoxin AbrB/MazE fold protein
MNKTIHAVFENGLFPMVATVDLPEYRNVDSVHRLVASNHAWPENYYGRIAVALQDEIFERAGQTL